MHAVVRSHQDGYGAEYIRASEHITLGKLDDWGVPMGPQTCHGQGLYRFSHWRTRYGTEAGLPADAVYDRIEDDGRDAFHANYL